MQVRRRGNGRQGRENTGRINLADGKPQMYDRKREILERDEDEGMIKRGKEKIRCEYSREKRMHRKEEEKENEEEERRDAERRIKGKNRKEEEEDNQMQEKLNLNKEKYKHERGKSSVLRKERRR